MDLVGVACYSSADLLTWTHEGIVLPPDASILHADLHPSRVMERPTVLYNRKASQCVPLIDSPTLPRPPTKYTFNVNVMILLPPAFLPSPSPPADTSCGCTSTAATTRRRARALRCRRRLRGRSSTRAPCARTARRAAT